MQISDSEWQILKVLWMNGKLSSSEIIKIIKNKFNWADSTIRTLIFRLDQKGAVIKHQENKTVKYSADISVDKGLKLVVDNTKDKVCSKNIKDFLTDIIESSDFTDYDVQELIKQLSNKATVKEVKCDCFEEKCRA